MEQRDHSIDVLRFIGLALIFVAHAKPGDPFFQFRCFDVPMMLFISGLSYSGREISNYLKFAWTRTKRLFIPLYSFLICYFLLKWALSEMGICNIIPQEKIWGSFALFLNPSIGKVWIFRVFFIVMLLTPPLVALEKKLSCTTFWAVFVLMFAVQFVLVKWVHPLKLGRFVEDWCLYAAGYSIPFFLGCHLRNAPLKYNLVTVAILLVCFAAAALFVIDGPWLNFQKIKYPPHDYFLLWGCLMSTVLWASRKWWMPILDCRFTRWIGRSTIWIYIWHTPFVCDVTKVYMKECHWSLRLAVLAAAGVGLYAIQHVIVSSIARKHPDSKVLKYFI